MKKFLLIGLAATAILTGCSNDDTVEMAPQKAIGFETFVGKSTRAYNSNADLDKNTLTQFKVYGNYWKSSDTGNGTKVFDGTTVTGAVATENSWTYAGKQYWLSDANYWFSAIAPASSSSYTHSFASQTSAPGESTHIQRTISFDNSADGANAKEDLIFAYKDCEQGSAHQSDGGGERVAFTFKHLLSRIKITLKNKCGSVNELKITDLKMTGVQYGNADYVTTTDDTADTYGNWSPIGTASDLAFESPRMIYEAETVSTDNPNNVVVYFDSQSANEYDPIIDHRYIVPFTPANGQVTITFSAQAINIDDSEVVTPSTAKSFTATATIEGGFKQGYSYNFTADITLQNLDPDLQYPIEFTVTEVNGYTDKDIDLTLTTTNSGSDSGAGS